MKMSKIHWACLRASTMVHVGFRPGIMWKINTTVMDKLERAGLVERAYEDDDEACLFPNAVATSQGHSLIREVGRKRATENAQ